MRNRHRSPCYRELSGCRRDSTPNRRSVAWCAASIWSAPDGPGLLTLGASSVQTDPDRSRRIVWMINRMIKRLGRCLAIEAPRRLRAQYSESGGRSTRGHESHQSADRSPGRTDGPGCADRARHGVRKRSSSRRHRPPRVRWACVWPPRAAATPRSWPVGRSRAAPIASDGHVGRRITTVSFNHEPDPAYRRFRSSPATTLATP